MRLAANRSPASEACRPTACRDGTRSNVREVVGPSGPWRAPKRGEGSPSPGVWRNPGEDAKCRRACGETRLTRIFDRAIGCKVRDQRFARRDTNGPLADLSKKLWFDAWSEVTTDSIRTYSEKTDLFFHCAVSVCRRVISFCGECLGFVSAAASREIEHYHAGGVLLFRRVFHKLLLVSALSLVSLQLLPSFLFYCAVPCGAALIRCTRQSVCRRPQACSHSTIEC